MRFVHSEQEQDYLLQRHARNMGLPNSYAAGNITALSSSFFASGLSQRTKLAAWVAASVDLLTLVRTEMLTYKKEGPGSLLKFHRIVQEFLDKKCYVPEVTSA